MPLLHDLYKVTKDDKLARIVERQIDIVQVSGLADRSVRQLFENRIVPDFETACGTLAEKVKGGVLAPFEEQAIVRLACGTDPRRTFNTGLYLCHEAPKDSPAYRWGEELIADFLGERVPTLLNLSFEIEFSLKAAYAVCADMHLINKRVTEEQDWIGSELTMDAEWQAFCQRGAFDQSPAVVNAPQTAPPAGP